MFGVLENVCFTNRWRGFCRWEEYELMDGGGGRVNVREVNTCRIYIFIKVMEFRKSLGNCI